MTHKIIEIVKSKGYQESYFGYYYKITESYKHWIGSYEDYIRVYSNKIEDKTYQIVYDTGYIKINEFDLENLIEILTSNHN